MRLHRWESGGGQNASGPRRAIGNPVTGVINPHRHEPHAVEERPALERNVYDLVLWELEEREDAA